MKKTIVCFIAFLVSLGLSAKQWPISTSQFTQYSIEIPENFKCIYDGDSAKAETRYLFVDEESHFQFYIQMVEIENIDVDKVNAFPDTTIFPTLKDKEIISRAEISDGLLSRIITMRNSDKTTTRLYVYITRNGLIYIDAKAKNDNYEQIDVIAQSVEKHFEWKKLLLLILYIAIVFGCIGGLGALLEKAWMYRKINKTKFWLYLLSAIAVAAIIAIVGPTILHISYWLVFLFLLGISAFWASCLINGVVIIAF